MSVAKVDYLEEKSDYLRAIWKIVNIAGKKKLFLAIGQCELIRYIGLNFGVCMYLCVRRHGLLDTPYQPILKKVKVIGDNNFKMLP